MFDTNTTTEVPVRNAPYPLQSRHHRYIRASARFACALADRYVRRDGQEGFPRLRRDATVPEMNELLGRLRVRMAELTESRQRYTLRHHIQMLQATRTVLFVAISTIKNDDHRLLTNIDFAVAEAVGQYSSKLPMMYAVMLIQAAAGV